MIAGALDDAYTLAAQLRTVLDDAAEAADETAAPAVADAVRDLAYDADDVTSRIDRLRQETRTT